ncbi:MAG: tetratricopeptide repeat protein [Planctomycetota bacterium]|nr:tetratricopeptide repeat protein [Planctomycetota bacterium]
MHAENVYLFRHALLRDAAYQMQLPGERARLHDLSARLLEALFGGRPPLPPDLLARPAMKPQPHPTDAIAEELAEHLHLADLPALRDLRVLYLRRAAEHADAAFQHDSALRCWKQLAEMLPGAESIEALRRAAATAFYSGRMGEAENLSLQAAAAARQAADERAAGVALGGLVTVYLATARLELAESTQQEALALHRRSGDSASECVALGNLAMICNETGRVQEAEDGYLAALQAARKAGDRRYEGVLTSNLAIVLQTTGRAAEAVRMYRKALAIHREVGNRHSECVALANLGIAARLGERHPESEQYFAEALAVAKQTGNLRVNGMVLDQLAALYRDTGRLQQAEQTLLQAIRIHREVQNRVAEAAARAGLVQTQDACRKAGIPTPQASA